MPQVSLWVWLGVVVVATVVELCTMDMTSIWFAASGIVALILSAFPQIHWLVQLIVFIVLSSVFIVGLRPICRKIMLRHMNEKTNVDSLIGKKVFMIATAKFGQMGAVKIADVVWSVVPEDELQTIEEVKIVEVVAINGNKLIVKAVEEADNK